MKIFFEKEGNQWFFICHFEGETTEKSPGKKGNKKAAPFGTAFIYYK